MQEKLLLKSILKWKASNMLMLQRNLKVVISKKRNMPLG